MPHPYFIAGNVWKNNPSSEEVALSECWPFNWVEGLVRSQHVGEARTCVRIRIGRRIDLSVKRSLGRAGTFMTGQRAVAMIPAEAVHLEAGLFRRSTQHLNRWYGRIVLVKPSSQGLVITAKVHGESWSLKCASPIVGSSQPPRTWDPVNIVVDPHAIELVPSHGATLHELDDWECMRH